MGHYMHTLILAKLKRKINAHVNYYFSNRRTLCVISSFATLMSTFIFLLLSLFLVLGDCDFQKDFCTWTNLRGDQFNWTRRSGSTLSSLTGPDRDRLGTTSGNVQVKLSNTGPVSIYLSSVTKVVLHRENYNATRKK